MYQKHAHNAKTGLSQSNNARLDLDVKAVKHSNIKGVYYGALSLMATFAGGAILSYHLFLYLPATLSTFAPGIASMIGIGLGLAYIAIAGREKHITPEVIKNHDRHKQGGFTMVEMLAVMAVMAVVCTLSIPNGLFAKGTGELHVARAMASSFEMGKSNYLARYGAEAGTSWTAAYQENPSVGRMYQLIANAGCFPPEWSSSYSGSSAEMAFQGYQVVVPATVSSGITVYGPDNQIVYPN